MKIRIISLNIGGTTKVIGDVTPQPLKNLAGISNLLKRKAAEVTYTAIGLQEIGNYLEAGMGINQPWYFDDKMGAGWANRFLRLLKPGEPHSPDIYTGGHKGDGYDEYRNGSGTAGFGNAVISNMQIIKTLEFRYNYDPGNHKPAAGLHEIPEDPARHDVYAYGHEQKGALAVKLSVDNMYMWFITTHLALEVEAVKRQVWQLLGFIGSLDPALPVIVTGDFNICQNGINNYIENDDILLSKHKDLYKATTKIFNAAGFVQLGEKAGFSFKPWNLNTRIDYCFMLNPVFGSSKLKATNFEIIKPDNGEAGTDYFFTDHCGLLIDFKWTAK